MVKYTEFIESITGHLFDIKPETKDQLFQIIVDTPFIDKTGAISIDLGITVLLMVNEKQKTIQRIALSRTIMARGAVAMSAIPFKKILIPIGHPQNIIATAIDTGKVQRTSDWKDLFIPALSARQARFNQSGAGIESSIVSPLNINGGGAMIFSFFQPLENLREDLHYRFVKQYSELVSQTLSRHHKLFSGQRTKPD